MIISSQTCMYENIACKDYFGDNGVLFPMAVGWRGWGWMMMPMAVTGPPPAIMTSLSL